MVFLQSSFLNLIVEIKKLKLSTYYTHTHLHQLTHTNVLFTCSSLFFIVLKQLKFYMKVSFILCLHIQQLSSRWGGLERLEELWLRSQGLFGRYNVFRLYIISPVRRLSMSIFLISHLPHDLEVGTMWCERRAAKPEVDQNSVCGLRCH